MAETRAQSFDNHGKYRPEYHIVVFFILLANFLWAGYSLFQGLTGGAVVALLMSIALIVMFFSLRVQILTVQDRVIRLEMRQRFRSVLAADVAHRACCPSAAADHRAALRQRRGTSQPGERGDFRTGQRAQGHQAEGAGLAG